jgi:hypothetical protein
MAELTSATRPCYTTIRDSTQRGGQQPQDRQLSLGQRRGRLDPPTGP